MGSHFLLQSYFPNSSYFLCHSLSGFGTICPGCRQSGSWAPVRIWTGPGWGCPLVRIANGRRDTEVGDKEMTRRERVRERGTEMRRYRRGTGFARDGGTKEKERCTIKHSVPSCICVYVLLMPPRVMLPFETGSLSFLLMPAPPMIRGKRLNPPWFDLAVEAF